MATQQTMIHKPYWKWSAQELSQAYKTLEVSPVDVLQALLAHIDRLNPTLNVFVFLSKNTLTLAHESARRWLHGVPLSPLDGVPLAVKDNLHVQGMPTSWGNLALKDSLIERSEWAVQRCEEAGMLVLGKTNVPELTLDGVTTNPVFGTTCNPWDTQTTPGGSSGGSVAAVASGMATIALATDGGGSIRRPCAHTGLLGLKPTSERIPRDGGLPRILMDFEVVGPIARTHQDMVMLYDIINPVPQPIVGAQPRKILVITQLEQQPVDPDIVAATIDIADQLSNLGHQVQHGNLPLNLDAFYALWPVLGDVGVAYAFSELPSMKEHSQQKFLLMAERGEQVSAVQWMKAWESVTAFRSEVNAMFQQWDLVLMPSIASTAWSIDIPFPSEIAGKEVGPRGHALFTGWVNVAGNPAINLPVKAAKNGSTIGVQFIADWHQEALLLALSKQLSDPNPAWQWPPITNKMECL